MAPPTCEAPDRDPTMVQQRPYRKARRAELEEETRQRIVDALIHLHGSIGPARTTVAAVAEEAGVQRATVYRHFPDESAMFAACSGKWMQQHPPPDPARWAELAEGPTRVRAAIRELYAWYERTHEMLANVWRDASLVEALAPAVQELRDYLAECADALAGESAPRVWRATIHHALSFTTWQSLVQENGLGTNTAVTLLMDWITATSGR